MDNEVKPPEGIEAPKPPEGIEAPKPPDEPNEPNEITESEKEKIWNESKMKLELIQLQNKMDATESNLATKLTNLLTRTESLSASVGDLLEVARKPAPIPTPPPVAQAPNIEPSQETLKIKPAKTSRWI